MHAISNATVNEFLHCSKKEEYHNLRLIFSNCTLINYGVFITLQRYIYKNFGYTN